MPYWNSLLNFIKADERRVPKIRRSYIILSYWIVPIPSLVSNFNRSYINHCNTAVIQSSQIRIIHLILNLDRRTAFTWKPVFAVYRHQSNYIFAQRWAHTMFRDWILTLVLNLGQNQRDNFVLVFFYDAQCGYIFFIGKFFDTIAKNTDQTYITCYTFRKTVKKNLTYTIKNADNI